MPADEKKEKFPSTFTVDNFSSTTKLADNEYKIPIGSVETITEKPYEPYEHRTIDNPNTFFDALVHLLKSSLGTGILAIPSAFAAAGIVTGIVGTLFTGLLCTHTIHLLVAASQEICRRAKKPMLGFSETAEMVFLYGPKAVQSWASFAKNFVDIALLLTYYAGNAVYIVFICASIQELVAYYEPTVGDVDVRIYMVVLMLPLILCCQIRELKHLVPFSFIANTTMIIAFGITAYYLFKGIEDVDISDRKLFNDISQIPAFFSTVIFAMEGIGTMLPIENSMKKQQFIGCPGVLNTAMTFVTLLFSVIGVFGYIRFGDNVHTNIISDLPDNEIPAQVAKACISISVFFTFMLQFYVPCDITWRRIQPRISEERRNIAQICLRTVLVMFITSIAIAVPRLELIISLVGSVFFSTLGLFIPASIDIVLNLTTMDFGFLNWRLIKNIFIQLISVFALVSGCYSTVEDMI